MAGSCRGCDSCLWALPGGRRARRLPAGCHRQDHVHPCAVSMAFNVHLVDHPRRAGVTLLIMSLIITWIWLDHRRQTMTLADVEARGITRRSERPNEGQS